MLAMRTPEEGAAQSPVPVATLLALVVAATPAAGRSEPDLLAMAEEVGADFVELQAAMDTVPRALARYRCAFHAGLECGFGEATEQYLRAHARNVSAVGVKVCLFNRFGAL